MPRLYAFLGKQRFNLQQLNAFKFNQIIKQFSSKAFPQWFSSITLYLNKCPDSIPLIKVHIDIQLLFIYYYSNLFHVTFVPSFCNRAPYQICIAIYYVQLYIMHSPQQCSMHFIFSRLYLIYIAMVYFYFMYSRNIPSIYIYILFLIYIPRKEKHINTSTSINACFVVVR